MSTDGKSSSPLCADAQQVFRQFAWNLAGTLAGKKHRTSSPILAAKSPDPRKSGPRLKRGARK